MDLNNIEIILASSSTSRQLLFKQAQIPYKVIVSGVDETVPDEYTPAETVEALAKRKAAAVLSRVDKEAVIAADSVVSIDGEIFGKPKDKADAFNMLKRLSGRKHEIFTGVCILYSGKEEVFSQKTEVEFYQLTDTEIWEYIETGEPFGKAGSYGIESRGVLLIKSICGDYSNIVGIPIAETIRRLKKLI